VSELIRAVGAGCEDAGMDHVFVARLVRWTGPSAWVFAPVPDAEAPERAGAFGRVPVLATVDGRRWATSVWHDRTAGWLLPVPKRIRGEKDDGDEVTVGLEVDVDRLDP
jgi:hypothetical protein